MRFEKLSYILFKGIKSKIKDHIGLSIFAKERAKFEGWLKVELCESLSKYFKDVVPEKNRIDITFKDWAIELKTVNTNVRYKNVEDKTRPITKNIQGVIKDIKKLKLLSYKNKAVLFIVFPMEHSNKRWRNQLNKISRLLKKIKYREFHFKKKIPGVIYFGLI